MVKNSKRVLVIGLVLTITIVFTLMPVKAGTTSLKTPEIKTTSSKVYKENKTYKKGVQFYWTYTKGARYDVLMWTEGKSKNVKREYTGNKKNTVWKTWTCEKKPYKVKCKVRTIKCGKISKYSKTIEVTIPAK